MRFADRSAKLVAFKFSLVLTERNVEIGPVTVPTSWYPRRHRLIPTHHFGGKGASLGDSVSVRRDSRTAPSLSIYEVY